MRNSEVLDVLIIGAGPTGTALAIDLARRGVHVRVLDRAARAFDGSRAKGVQPRTLEVLHDLGALEEVLERGSLYPKLGLHVGPLTIPWRMMSYRKATEAVPYPNTWLIPQFRIDAALHRRLAAFKVNIEFGRELLELTQFPDFVSASVAAPGGPETVRARYVVGADGGSSRVRTCLGIGFAGTTHEEDRIVIVDAVTEGLSRDRWHVWPRPRLMGACPLPFSDLYQWMIRLAPDETPPQTVEEVNARVRQQSGNRKIVLRDIQWKSVFRPNIRLAEHYRQDRVMIAGDAAHVHTPAGAQGLNTGVQDAYNLGWKLAQVLAGADSRLLDTYEAERQPIAAAVLGLSTMKYAAMGKLSTASITRGKDEQQLALSYHGGPLASASVERLKTIQVGDRAPDAHFVDAAGQRVRLFDAFRGPHFTAIAYGAQAIDALHRLVWSGRGASLKRIFVPGVGGPNRDEDTASLRQIYGLTQDVLLLVRPDGYIGHIATRRMLESIDEAVGIMTPPKLRQGQLEPHDVA